NQMPSPLRIRGNHIVDENGGIMTTLFLDPRKNPKELDSIVDKKVVRKGIYRVEEDKLTIAGSLDKFCPKEFPTGQSSTMQLMTYRREGAKPAKDKPASYAPLHLTGPSEGKRSSFIEEWGSDPTVIVFTREFSPSLPTLMTRLNTAITKHKDAKLHG